MKGLRLPDASGRWALATAAAVWAGALVGRLLPTPAAAVLSIVTGTAAWGVRRAVVVVVAAGIAAGALSGALATSRETSILSAPVADGPVEALAVAAGDSRLGRFGPVLFLRLLDEAGRPGPPLLTSGGIPDVAAGEVVRVTGTVEGRGGRVFGDPVAGRIHGARVGVVGPAANPLLAVANRLRSAALSRIDPSAGPPRALLAGFLVGDVGRLPAADAESLRRAGLSHFVAVSGSNVALFLLLWWALLGPLGTRPLLRSTTGLAGLVLFALLTRWEPSVVRASVMAGAMLVGRLAGVPLDAWTSLGLAVAGVLLVSAELAVDVGFQLSVAATAGVLLLAGAGVPGRRRLAAVGATVGAQLAVGPILLAAFGEIPLVAPVANLMASPLVAAATSIGAVGVILGFGPAVEVAVRIAGAVLAVAHLAAPWPTVGWLGFAAISATLAAAVGLPGWRRPLLAGLAVVVVVAGLPGPRVERPAVVFFDVGQGDSALVLGREATVLIDGGPDPGLLAAKLARVGVGSIDLVVASHVHADHLDGLAAVVGRMPVGALWASFGPHVTDSSRTLLSTASGRGVPVVDPPVGESVTIGDVGLRVLGPVRRYAGPNDQSLVVEVTLDGRIFLFPGDIETYAQADLGPLRRDVLKVPHQGGATSDVEWLRESAGAVSVISVGPNDYGHPDADVISVLQGAGSVVMRTDERGDIVIHPADVSAAASSPATGRRAGQGRWVPLPLHMGRRELTPVAGGTSRRGARPALRRRGR